MRTEANAPLKMYRIEVDGHFHGGEPPRPWVARIDGPDEKFGLRREFIRPLNDWKDARKAWSGNTYGVVAMFPLRDGHLYEVSRCRGSSSKRYVAREFYSLGQTKMHKIEPVEALDRAAGYEASATLRLGDNPDDRPWAAEVLGLGTPRRLGFVVVDNDRLYRLRDDRLYEVHEGGAERFLLIEDGRKRRLTQAEALSWLASR